MIATGANVSRRRKPSASKPRCDWCSHSFKRSRSDQRYCCPACRRRACERRRAETIRAVADYFAPYGLSAERVRECADADLTRLRGVLALLGMVYQEHERRWVRAA